MGLKLTYINGQTPLDENEIDGLLIPTIASRAELDEFEQHNIEQALKWSLMRNFKYQDIFKEAFIKDLHKRMYNGIWTWAGEFRHTVLSSVEFEGHFIVSFSATETITSSTMKRSLELADYFFQSAIDVYKMVEKTTVAPEIVITAANLFKKGWKKIDIARAIYSKEVIRKLSNDALGKKIARDLDAWRKEYPNQFGANTRR